MATETPIYEDICNLLDFTPNPERVFSHQNFMEAEQQEEWLETTLRNGEPRPK